jgi:glutamate racemase
MPLCAMIGVFDSGIGGLTAVRELRRLRPDLDIVFYADTARIPYGTRSPETVTRYAGEALTFLASLGADAILIACGTVSSVALPRLGQRFPLPLWGVVEPSAQAAYRRSRSHRIGIIATQATVRSHAFEDALGRLGHVATYTIACPLFVSLAENGFTAYDDPVAGAAVAHYLKPLEQAQVDTLILGCTHFPLLAAPIARYLPHLSLVGAGESAAAALCATNPRVGHGSLQIYVSDSPGAFAEKATAFLGSPLPCRVAIKQSNEKSV